MLCLVNMVGKKKSLLFASRVTHGAKHNVRIFQVIMKSVSEEKNITCNSLMQDVEGSSCSDHRCHKNKQQQKREKSL